jgi:predicted ATPase
MLTKIRLENFKSWRELDLDLSNLTILFGTNSSGKSSVLQALLLLKQTAMGFDRSLAMNLGGGDTYYVDLGSYVDLVFKHEEEKRIGIRLSWNVIMPSSHVMLDSFPSSSNVSDDVPLDILYGVVWQKQSDDIFVEQLEYDVVNRFDERIFIHTQRAEANKYAFTTSEKSQEKLAKRVFVQSCYLISPSLDPPDFFLSDVWLTTQAFNRRFESLVQGVHYLGPLRSYPERLYPWRGAAPQDIGLKGEKTIEVLLASARNDPDLVRHVSFWLAKLGLVNTFDISSIDNAKRFYEPRVKIGAEQVNSALIDVGFGISQVLPIITLLFSALEGSIVLIEQPELHLHPSAQAGLADLFLHVAETRNLQLIIESHSEHILTRLQRRIGEAENVYATPEHIKMYFCEAGENGSVTTEVEVDRFGHIKNWPKNFFGDMSGDIEAMSRAGIERRRQELEDERRQRELSSND